MESDRSAAWCGTGEKQKQASHQGVECGVSCGVESVPYSDFECVVETEDLFLLVYGERVTVLQKKDLAAGDPRDFSSMMAENITKYAVVSFAEQGRAAK